MKKTFRLVLDAVWRDHGRCAVQGPVDRLVRGPGALRSQAGIVIVLPDPGGCLKLA